LSGDITAADVLSQGSCDLPSEVGWKLQHLRSLYVVRGDGTIRMPENRSPSSAPPTARWS
jgi:hypothetical protein